MTPQEVGERIAWNDALLALPAPHLLQTWEWGGVKSQTGWRARRLCWRSGDRIQAAASLLTRRLGGRLPLAIGYVPKGPLLDWTELELAGRVLAELEGQARRERLLFLKIDPDVRTDEPVGRGLMQLLRQRSWLPSAEQIQFRNTALLNIALDDDALLANMKPKTRYNVRLAGRRGVRASRGGPRDLALFYARYVETGARDGFLVRPFAYYEATWRTFLQGQGGAAPCAHLLLAHVPEEEEPVAGLMLFTFGPTAWYLYGASGDHHRERMPNYLLQWEAMRLARELGCRTYDLWGAPDELHDADPLFGVWRFKEGFGAQFAPHIGAWDFPASRALYPLYTRWMPRVLDLMRSRHRDGSL